MLLVCFWHPPTTFVLLGPKHMQMRVARFVFVMHVCQTNYPMILFTRIYAQNCAIKQQLSRFVKYRPRSPILQVFYNNNNITYHDFIPTPWRDSHVRSHNTHTIMNIHPLAHILDICDLIFGS